MEKRSDILDEFIRDLIPKPLLKSGDLLISLDYPIPDRKTYLQQLEERLKKEKHADENGDLDEDHRPMALLSWSLGPEDFPISTPRGALEKVFSKVTRWRGFLPNPIPFGPTPRDPLPIGPRLPPESSSLPSEPRLVPPLDPDFGNDACGRAAKRLWQEHLESREAALLGGPSPAVYADLRERVERCRDTIGTEYSGVCGPRARDAYALCILRGGFPIECREEARRALSECERMFLGGIGSDIFGGRWNFWPGFRLY